METLSAVLGKLAIALSLISVALAQTANYPIPAQKPATVQNLTIPSALERVAACESTGNPNGTPRQFNSDGSILWGMNASGTIIQRDCGEFQVNTWAHGRYPNGLDVCGSQADNEKYALSLYKQYGLQPWDASKGCWQ
jgi:hypothetical protein